MEQRFAIFDMDGTLVDSMMYWHNLGQEYLESKGVTGDLNEVLERSKPMTMVESGALFIQEFGLAGTPESATAEDLVQVCLTRLGVADYFEFLLSCETVGTGKNRPDVYFAAAERLGAAVENTVVYEDAWYAVRTAKNAGFRVVAIYDNNSRARWDEIRAMADTPIESWTELLEA